MHTRNEHYDLVSVLYHSLRSASSCERYVRDARKSDDREFAQFFDEPGETDRRRADRAMEMLSTRRS